MMFFTGDLRVFTESLALRAFTIPARHSHSQSTSVLLRAHVRGDPEKSKMFCKLACMNIVNFSVSVNKMSQASP